MLPLLPSLAILVGCDCGWGCFCKALAAADMSAAADR